MNEIPNGWVRLSGIERYATGACWPGWTIAWRRPAEGCASFQDICNFVLAREKAKGANQYEYVCLGPDVDSEGAHARGARLREICQVQWPGDIFSIDWGISDMATGAFALLRHVKPKGMI